MREPRPLRVGSGCIGSALPTAAADLRGLQRKLRHMGPPGLLDTPSARLGVENAVRIYLGCKFRFERSACGLGVRETLGVLRVRGCTRAQHSLRGRELRGRGHLPPFGVDGPVPTGTWPRGAAAGTPSQLALQGGLGVNYVATVARRSRRRRLLAATNLARRRCLRDLRPEGWVGHPVTQAREGDIDVDLVAIVA